MYEIERERFDRRTKFPFEKKLKLTRQFIQEVLRIYDNPAIACSFGKDSMVVLFLVLEYKPDIIVVFNNTGVEYPTTVKFARRIAKEWSLNFYEVKPETTFWRVVEKYGYPHMRFNKEKPKCCYYLKDKPAKEFYKKKNIDLVFTGMTYDESYQRRWTFIKYGWLHKSKEGVMKAHPIAYWSSKEVWNFIRDNNIPVNPTYEKYRVDRVGCVTCTAFIGWEKQMSRNFPKIYEKIRKETGQPYLPMYIP